MTPLRPGVALAVIIGMSLVLWAIVISAAMAQNPPKGADTLNQGIQARLLTKSDTTVIQKTRGLFIGDAAACNLTVRFVGDTVAQAVALNNVQPGELLPIQIIQLMAATTCTTVVAIY
jgi:hypothetical protein